MRRLVFLVLAIAASPGVVLAAVPASGGSGSTVSASSPDGAASTSSALPYGDRSDEELTALAADWDALDRHQRRALLTEMKLRMARKGESGNVLHIRTERRYGRLIRQSDGRVIRIETQVVHVRPVVEADDLEARQSFGVGFENRVGSRERDTAGVEQQEGRAAAGDDSAADGDVGADGAHQPSLNSVLDSLAPSTRAPAVNRLPIYQVSDPES